MPITINGSGSVVGLTAGGLPDATVTPADLTQPLTFGTVQAATGTSVDFTGIPSWVKRITLMFDGVSTNGTSLPLIQLGDSGGIEATGYTGVTYTVVAASSATIAYSVGFTLAPTSNWLATALVYGSYTLSLMNVATNTWAIQGTIGRPDGVYVFGAGGTKSLSATLDRIRLTTTNGTDTFDAGTINILYE